MPLWNKYIFSVKVINFPKVFREGKQKNSLKMVNPPMPKNKRR
jgi:hypothetical protein